MNSSISKLLRYMLPEPSKVSVLSPRLKLEPHALSSIHESHHKPQIASHPPPFHLLPHKLLDPLTRSRRYIPSFLRWSISCVTPPRNRGSMCICIYDRALYRESALYFFSKLVSINKHPTDPINQDNQFAIWSVQLASHRLSADTQS